MINPEELAYRPHEKKFKFPKFKKPGKRAGLVLIVFAAGIVAVGGYYGYQKFKTPPAEVAGAIDKPQAPKEVEDIIAKVKTKSQYVPEAELPSMATITDLSKLENQAFFEGAQKGDKVLIYAISQKAYLYRPSTDKLIRESEVFIENDPYNPVSSESAEPSLVENVLRIKF